jgi:hypothetical protein
MPGASSIRISFLTYPHNQVLENPGGPEKDIVFLDPVAHGGHASGFFCGRVLQGFIDVVCDLPGLKGLMLYAQPEVKGHPFAVNLPIQHEEIWLGFNQVKCQVRL